MRKISPQGIRDDFSSQLTDLTRFYQTGMSALSNDKDRSTLTEHSLVAAAVAWEGFVSDLFIAYINGDASRFKQHLQSSFEEYLKIKKKQHLVFERFGRLQFPTHLTKSDVLSLANIHGKNIAFPNFEGLEDRASKWLITSHSDKFKKQSESNKSMVNALISMRNHIAHRSQLSHEAMNENLVKNVLNKTGIYRAANKINNLGAWLKATPNGKDKPRINIIIESLNSIASSC